jgi:hypothetical protein
VARRLRAAAAEWAITAVQPESWDREGVRSLEVRWIFPGQLPAAMAGWFGLFPAQTIALRDAYLMDPYLPGLSMKVREGRALEVKAHHGSPGLLEVTGRAHGRLESWHKWSFPCDPPSQENADPAAWRTVRKTRRITRFSLAGGLAAAHVPEPDQGPGCAVELTEIRTQGEAWWTLGFEATGPADVLPSEFEAAAALVFARPLPAGVELGMGNSMSYAQWLRGPRERQ